MNLYICYVLCGSECDPLTTKHTPNTHIWLSNFELCDGKRYSCVSSVLIVGTVGTYPSMKVWDSAILATNYTFATSTRRDPKVLDNCYKTQITSYMDMIYFYSSKYIPPWSIHLFARSFNFFMLSRKAIFEMLLSSLVTAHWISSTVWKCRPFKENFYMGKRK